MSLSIYDAIVPNFIQTTGATIGFLEKGAAHFRDEGLDPNELCEARLMADMLPLRFQILSVVGHSIKAIEATEAGVFRPPSSTPPLDYAGLQAAVAEAHAALKAIDPARVNALHGKDMAFEFGSSKLPFTAENFLLSFSVPNFYFHAATAYDILRMKGAPVGKRDFLGVPRMKM
jgi:hypothetical protein